jgi:hypothetical protein
MADISVPGIIESYRSIWTVDPVTGNTPLINANLDAAAYIKQPLSSPTLAAIWCPSALEIAHRLPVSTVLPPPPDIWVVAPNGTSTTRPSFAIVNGARSFSSKTTIAVGSICDCTQKRIEGSLTFCNVSSALVAVCVKQTK